MRTCREVISKLKKIKDPSLPPSLSSHLSNVSCVSLFPHRDQQVTAVDVLHQLDSSEFSLEDSLTYWLTGCDAFLQSCALRSYLSPIGPMVVNIIIVSSAQQRIERHHRTWQYTSSMVEGWPVARLCSRTPSRTTEGLAAIAT